jgi:hypothetical protein
LAFLEDRAGEGHLEEIRLALARRPALAAWLAELVEMRDSLDSAAARQRFDGAEVPRMPPGLLREARRGLNEALRKAQPQPRVLRLREWLLGGYAVAATAVAAALFVSGLSWQTLRVSHAPGGGPPAGALPPAPVHTEGPTPIVPVEGPGESPVAVGPGSTPAVYGMAFLAGEGRVLGTRSRGVSASIDTLEFSAPTRLLYFTVYPPVSPPDVPADAVVEFALVGPGDQEFMRTRSALRDYPVDGKVAIFSDRPFPSGHYSLTVRGLWPGVEEQATPREFYLVYRPGR